MRNESEIREKLDERNILLSESIGQHLLVDKEAIDTLVNNIEYGGNVLEIGPGPGNLTEKIAERAGKVVAIEIDRRFEPILNELQSQHSNIEVIYKDAISLNFGKILKTDSSKEGWQVISNLPFHISEPFLQKLINIPIENAVLIIGDQLARKTQISNPNDIEFSKLSLLTKTFFEPTVISNIDRKLFYPQPRTDASIIILNPREKKEFENHPSLKILRNLFLTERNNPTVIKVIKESNIIQMHHSLMSKPESHRYDRRQIRQELKQMVQIYHDNDLEIQRTSKNRKIVKLNLPKDLLDKPFSRFDNQDIKVLARALDVCYGQF